jgi:hypothetical protein
MTTSPVLRSFLGLSLLLSCSRGGGGSDRWAPLPPLNLPDGCQPLLSGADCFLPYPSDFFRVQDPSLPSGHRIELRGAAKLRTPENISADLGDARVIDGFSRLPTVVAYFPTALSSEGLVSLIDPAENSLLATSPTVILEAQTGARIAHYVDLDPRADKPERQMILLRAHVGLKERTRYIVAFKGLKQKDGAAVVAPDGFRRLRDHQGASEPRLLPLQRRYDAEVFPALEAAGVSRESLQLAWDFTTGSDAHVMRDLLRVRELTLAWLSSNEPVVKVTKVDVDRYENIWRTVYGTLTVPLFMEHDGRGSPLARDASGAVRQNGTFEQPFMAAVPVSVRDQFAAGRPLVYGHGFFGERDQITNGAPRAIASRLKAVFFAVDWLGMSTDDIPPLVSGLASAPSQALIFTQRVPQGMAGFMTLSAAVTRSMRKDPAFRRPDAAGQKGVSVDASGKSNAGEVLFENGASNFLGISQGHVMGGVLAALDPNLSRLCLNVGGAGFTHMMFRARPFSPFLEVMGVGLPDPFEQRKFQATSQAHFDPIDPGFWARYVFESPLPGSPADRRILQQTALGDAGVPNIGSFLHARQLGLKVLKPSPVIPFGLEGVEGPVAGSALAIYDFGLDLKAIYRDDAPHPKDTPAHEGIRNLEPAITQMDQFFRADGKIAHTCDGPCDPR